MDLRIDRCNEDALKRKNLTDITCASDKEIDAIIDEYVVSIAL